MKEATREGQEGWEERIAEGEKPAGNHFLKTSVDWGLKVEEGRGGGIEWE